MAPESERATENEVDKVIYGLAVRELDDMPVGSFVRAKGVIGFKKMPLYWVLRVHGIRSAARQFWNDLTKGLLWKK